MEQKQRLLCMFIHESELELSIDYIKTKFAPNNIFVFENLDAYNQLFCTFTITNYYDLIDKIIIIHRKSETNTLYTINAINEIVKRMNNGRLLNDFPIDWTLYKNQLLLYKNGVVEYINYKFIEKIS